MKKILMLATTFPRWKNDTTPSFVFDLARGMSLKYEIVVLAPHYKKAKKHEIMEKVDVRRFAYFYPKALQKLCYDGGIIPNIKKSFLAKIQIPMLLASEFFNSYSIIKKEKPSIIHAHWSLPQGFIAVFLKRIFGLHLIVTIHGSDLFPLKNRIFKKLQRFVINNADFVTVNSEAARKEVFSRFPNINKKKLHVIPMGIDTKLFNPKKIRKPKKYSKNKILLFVGRLSDQKGLQYLLDSMPSAIKPFPEIKLLIIGEGPYKPELDRIIKNNKLQNYVEFLGAMPHDRIAYYYSIAGIFIMPALSAKTGTESLGLALIEAMASGCAVIGTKVGGIQYIIKHNYNGILVEQKDSVQLKNAILELLNDNKKFEKIKKNAPKIAKDYSWQSVSKKFQKLYEALK